MTARQTIYFASDFHLGVDARLSSREREARIVRWLEQIRHDAEQIFLVGDLFDFWFEYETVVPRGYVRLLGKLAELRDAGIAIECFTGNHDMWLFDYFSTELDIPVHREPIVRELHGKTFFIGHGDGLGPGDQGYKFLKQVFANPLCQWLFARLHPNFAFTLANFWSGRSRAANPPVERFHGADKEWLIAFAEAELQRRPEIDYFIFGHRHLPIDHLLSNDRSRYLNLGEWLSYCSYVRFDGRGTEHCFFETDPAPIAGRRQSTGQPQS
jgi:UDP-2,3-diacylglucosamine hydrolase